MKASATAEHCKGCRGFTILEVLVSLTLVAMVMAGAYLLITQTAQLSRAARDKYVAVTLCKNRLERARNFDYQDLHLMDEPGLVVNDNGAPYPRGMFRRITLVNTNYVPPVVSTNYAGGLTEVTVTVQIRNKRTGIFSSAVQETLSTLFTEYLD